MTISSFDDIITILHVDDEPDFADLAATFLERNSERFEVLTANSPEEGLDVLANQDVDCIVSDYDMPPTHGIEFLQSVRDDYPDLPFILFTGKGSEEVASDAISAGVTDYLQKETGSDQYAVLANRIRNYVQANQAESEREYMRDRMELALEYSDSIIFEINTETEKVSRLGNFKHFFDRDEAEARTVDEYIRNLVHPEDRDEFSQFYREFTDGNREEGIIEYRTNPIDGQFRWMRDNVHIDEENPHRALGLALDITEQKMSEEQREQVISRVTDAIVEVNADWEFTLVNEQAEALYDMDESDLLGRDFWEVFSEARGTRFEEEYRQVMETREPTSFVEYFSQLDGWFDIEAYPKSNGGIAFYFVEVTEQRERQQELEQANTLLSTLIETLPVGILAEDDTRNILTANERLFELFAMPGSPEDVVGADCERIADEVSGMFADSTQFIERINEAVSNRTPVRAEEIELRDGRTFARSYESIELPDGWGHLWLYRDITEQKTREERLQETTARLEVLYENSPDMIDVLDPEGTLLDVNHRFCEELGYEEAEVLGRPIWEIDQLVDEDDVRRLLADFDLDERRRFDGIYERSDGSTFPVEVHLLRLDVVGEDRFLAISRDITTRKQFERKLTALHEAAQDLFQADTRERVGECIVEATRDILGMQINGVAVLDESENVLRMIAQTDQSAELSQSDLTFPPGESLAWEAFETGELKHYEDVSRVPGRVNSDTSIRSEVIVPLGEHGVVLIGSTEAGVFDDVDISLAKTLATHAETALDRIARERELERQNERLGEFAGIVSHDLRNPLNVAEGRVELAQEECESEHLEDVENALERSQALIADLLTLAREGNRVDDIDTVDLGTLTENCWRNVATGEATLSCDIDRTIRADRSRLQQLLENLYRNAIEHGGDDVAVTVGSLPDGFYIEDDGPGIPADVRDDVFDTGYSTTKEGTGFGLSIVQQIVDAHGWEIRVTDGSDGGARFEITGVEFTDE